MSVGAFYRRSRRRVRLEIGSNHPELGIPKLRRIADEKDEDDAEHRRKREACMRIVKPRDHFRCRNWEDDRIVHTRNLHGHEILPRSLGGDDTDTRNVVLLCNTCHLWAVHGKRLVILGTDANKTLRFKRVR